MDSPPVVDRLPTRHLERLEVDRFSPLRTEVVGLGPSFVELRVTGMADRTHTRLPDGVELAGDPPPAPVLLTKFAIRLADGGDGPQAEIVSLPADTVTAIEVTDTGGR